MVDGVRNGSGAPGQAGQTSLAGWIRQGRSRGSMDVFNVQFVDCMPHKSGLQTGIQSANCVNPVCKLDKSSFRGLVCKWEIKRNELSTAIATAQTMDIYVIYIYVIYIYICV